MYRPAAYSQDDVEALHAQIRARVFATIAVGAEGRVNLAYAPVILDADGGLGRVRFHLAKSNPAIEALERGPAILSFLGPDAYVSPDWYQGGQFVPTWNYIAIEGEGQAERLAPEALSQMLADLSAQEEARLLPKAPWTLDKLSPGRQAMMFAAIVPFALRFTRLEGKFKLSQDKSAAGRAGVIGGLEARGDAASLSIAAAMRKP